MFAVIALLVSAFAQQPDTAVIEGVVRASGTDAPIAGADVNAFPATSGERVQAVTDTGGRFRLLVRPDRYQVTVTKVNLRPNPSLAFLSGSAVAGKDGAFVLNDVGVVHYRVELFGLPADAYIASARLGGADILENGFSLHGDSTGLMEIAVSGLGGRIVGVVRNPQNEIVPSGRVVLVPEPDLRSRRDLFKVATLDQYGRFNIQGITPGRYKLFAWDDVPFGAYFDSEFLRSYEDQAKAVTVQKNDYIQAEITLTPRVVKTGEFVER